MQKGSLTIFQCFKNTKKLPTWDWYHEFLESPSGKLQIRTTIGWSLELVHLSGSGPWTNGVAMGSPLAPLLANFFIGHYEKLWLNNYTGPKVLYYRRYVDDTICCFKNSIDARFFF